MCSKNTRDKTATPFPKPTQQKKTNKTKRKIYGKN